MAFFHAKLGCIDSQLVRISVKSGEMKKGEMNIC